MSDASIDTSIDDAAEVDGVLRRAGLRPTDEERERLIRIYPTIRGLADQLRFPEARYAEPAAIYAAVARG